MSRFATVEEVTSEEFMALIEILNKITVDYQLPDHSDINQERYPWSAGLLNKPEFYAARLWEYPFALFSAELKPGMKCLDMGCGMTAFTIYLKEIAKCDTVGIDPDFFKSGIRYKDHGGSKEFIIKTGLKIIKGKMESIPFPSNFFDRVFCLSVIEHVPFCISKQGMQEMARVLKPNGRLIVTVDVNMFSEISHPLDLMWNSGLPLLGGIDLQWPFHRFGIFCDRKQPADLFGMIFTKPKDYYVETSYSQKKKTVSMMEGYLIPKLRRPSKRLRIPIALLNLYKKLPNCFRRVIQRIIK